jgi:hypothetical protein
VRSTHSVRRRTTCHSYSRSSTTAHHPQRDFQENDSHVA